MRSVLPGDVTKALMEQLKTANARSSAEAPGDALSRQPVHVVYGGAHLFKADTPAKLGALARQAFETYAPDPETLADGVGLEAADPARQAWLAALVHERVRAKLAREPVEDYRIDFEDGFGIRPDREEDETAVQAARELAAALAAGTLPPFVGFRVKTLSEELKHRSLRTLDLFLTTLADATSGKLPPAFLVTLPKVVGPGQVAAFAQALDRLEGLLGFAPGALGLELMIETPQALVQADGRVGLPLLLEAGRGRVKGVHLGAYDYTASVNVTAASQSLDHPACDFARLMMQAALAGRPVFLSDGATNVMPVGPHRPAKGGPPLSPAQLKDNAVVVHRAWRLAYRNVRHALRCGFYQGWDLHPAQLVPRYAATYAFFLDALGPATDRLRAFVAKAAQASLVGDVFDDAATGQGLLNFFHRALACGAVTEAEVAATGLTAAEVRGRSFAEIVRARPAPGGA